MLCLFPELTLLDIFFSPLLLFLFTSSLNLQCLQYVRIDLHYDNECTLFGLQAMCVLPPKSEKPEFHYLSADTGKEYTLNKFAEKEDVHHEVFLWGLNDKGQLGGLRGSKVCTGTNSNYVLVPSSSGYRPTLRQTSTPPPPPF